MANSKLSNSTEQEQWEYVDGYEGIYEVSTFGEVRSYRNSKHGIHNKSKILKQTKAAHGYPTVVLFKDGKRKTFCIHRLMAETFIPNPKNYKCVLHKDDDKDNNSLNNLYWGSYKMNCKDRIRNSGIESMRQNTRLTETKVLEIRSIYDQGWATQQELADAYGVVQTTIQHVVARSTWTHI